MKKIVSILLCLTGVSWGAITYDTTANGGDTAGATLSWTHTMGSGANNAMVVCVNSYLSPLVNPTVTFDGQSLTLIKTQADPSSGYYGFIFYGVGFPSGSHTVSINDTSGTSYLMGGSASFLGVSQTGTPDNSGTNSGTSASPTISITPVAANAFAVDCLGLPTNGDTMTAGSWTNIQKYQGASNFSYGMSYTGPISGSSTDTWSLSSSQPYGFLALTMAPATITTNNALWFGAGQ